MRWKPVLLFTLTLLACGCGDSDSSDEGSSSAGSGSSGAAGTSAEGGTGGSSGGTAGSSGTSSGGSGGNTANIPCGDTECSVGQLCERESFAPSCTNLDNPDDDCPAGETKTQCGGAGIPCCCGPTPPATFTCIPTKNSCATHPPTCDCIECDPGEDCATIGSVDSGVLECSAPPAP